MDSFAKQSLDAHNKYRSKHHAPPIAWSDSMAKEAQAFAEKVAKSGKLQHASREERNGDGENVFMMMGKPDVTGDDVVDTWYSEVKKYDYKKGGFQSGTGHFTQVVWKGSKELGMGKAKSPDGKIFVVGRYRPAGNNISYVNDNVSPETGKQGGEAARSEPRSQPTRGGLHRDTDDFFKDFKGMDIGGKSGGAKTDTKLDMDSFPKQSLDAHNKYRSKHHAPPIAWSDSMAKEAQAFAEKVAKSGKLQHASREERNGDGENVFMMMGKPDLTGDDVTDTWYSEVKKYDYKKGGFQSGTGHFTQVVWKGSKELGMGKAKSPDGKIFVVGRYRPAGNNISYVNDNVSPQ